MASPQSQIPILMAFLKLGCFLSFGLSLGRKDL